MLLPLLNLLLLTRQSAEHGAVEPKRNELPSFRERRGLSIVPTPPPSNLRLHFSRSLSKNLATLPNKFSNITQYLKPHAYTLHKPLTAFTISTSTLLFPHLPTISPKNHHKGITCTTPHNTQAPPLPSLLLTLHRCHRPWYWREIYPDYGASR